MDYSIYISQYEKELKDLDLIAADMDTVLPEWQAFNSQTIGQKRQERREKLTKTGKAKAQNLKENIQSKILAVQKEMAEKMFPLLSAIYVEKHSLSLSFAQRAESFCKATGSKELFEAEFSMAGTLKFFDYQAYLLQYAALLWGEGSTEEKEGQIYIAGLKAKWEESLGVNLLRNAEKIFKRLLKEADAKYRVWEAGVMNEPKTFEGWMKKVAVIEGTYPPDTNTGNITVNIVKGLEGR